MRMQRGNLLAIILLMMVLPSFAHHGNAAYDTTNIVTVQGKITDFQFINPHVMIFFEAKNDKGNVEKWQGELTSPNHLMRTGWTKGTLKPGDQVTFSGLKAKSGASTLWITKIIAEGHEIALAPAD